MRIVTGDQGQNVDNASQLHPELQFARCMSNRYRSEQFPRCVSCTRRWAGDTCRFQGIRFFLKDHQRNIVGVSFVENQRADAPSMHFPSSWNVPLTLTHIRRTKVRKFNPGRVSMLTIRNFRDQLLSRFSQHFIKSCNI